MSRQENWKGNIKEIFFPKTMTIQDKCEWLNLNGYPSILEENDEDEYYITEKEYKENPIFDIHGKIFVSIDLEEYDTCEIREIANNGDNAYFINVGFYNGSCSLKEAIEECLNQPIY